MSISLLLLGILILLVVLTDLVWASLWVDRGAGPITRTLTNKIWQFMKKIDDNNKVLKFSGPIIILINLLVWIVFLWLGWALVFMSFPGGLIDTVSNRPLGIVDYLYYSGYVIFTLGSGDFAPVSNGLKLVSAFASGIGMVFLTLSVSYIISIIDGVVQKRSVVRQIYTLGRTPEEVIENMWKGNGFYNLDNILHGITLGINDITFKEKAYPLLHFYHPSDKFHGLSYTLPILDDAITILEYAIDGDYNLNILAVKQLRSAISFYIDSFSDYGKNLFEVTDDNLQGINLSRLKDINIPLISQEEFDKILLEVRDRRLLLANISMEDWGKFIKM